MVRITIQDEGRVIDDPKQIVEFLKPYGIWYEHWPVDGRIGKDANNEEILTAYSTEIERLKHECGFVIADVINVNRETPGLDAMLAKFDKEHTHSEDEVRFTVRGGGVFHIDPDGGPVFAIEVRSGDLINVPKGTKHWFTLCDDKTIRCIRLFEDPSGWTPEYVENGVHQKYEAMCFGPRYLGGATIEPIVNV